MLGLWLDTLNLQHKECKMNITKVCGRDVVLPNPKNNHEVFLYVANFLLNQTERCMIGKEEDDGAFCSYRSNDRTNACAAGCLIPDDEYIPEMETGSVYSHGVKDYFIEKGYSLSLLSELQSIHDSRYTEHRKEMLNKFYARYFKNTEEK